MLLRICLIVAILAGLGAGGLAYYEFSTQIPQIEKQRNDEKDAKVKEIGEHNQTKAKLKKTESELASTKTELAEKISDLAKSEARADAQSKRADDLSAKLTKTTADLQEASDQVAAYKASGLSPDEVVKLDKNLKAAQVQIAGITGERELWHRRWVSTDARLQKYEGGDEERYVKLPSELKGTVVVVDPKWDFVVINIGEEKGAVQDGEMLVSRDGKLVAKVVIRNVQKDRSIANIVPGWKLGEVIEGDVVTPAHPASS